MFFDFSPVLVFRKIYPQELIEKKELFDLFKKSSIGQNILSLTHYKQKLIENLEEEDIVLED